MIILNGVPVNYFKFPAGEVQIKLPTMELESEIIIELRYESSDDIIALMMLNSAVTHANLVYHTKKLVMKYVPFARQDRKMNSDEAISIKVFAKLINSMDFDSVEIWDPHSDVTSALIDNSVVIPQEELFKKAVDDYFITSNFVVVAPDQGATKKAFNCAKAVGSEIIYAQKHRDVRTGEITKVTCAPWSENGHQVFFVIDDICDGGRSFIELAKCFEPNHYLMLYVTHGIFSNGALDKLFEVYDEIYVANMVGTHVDVNNYDNLHIL